MAAVLQTGRKGDCGQGVHFAPPSLASRSSTALIADAIRAPVTGRPLSPLAVRARNQERRFDRPAAQDAAGDLHRRSERRLAAGARWAESLLPLAGREVDRRGRVAQQLRQGLAVHLRAIREKHLPRYLAEFSYRFNRRFDLASMLARLTAAAARTPPMSYRLVKLAEAHW